MCKILCDRTVPNAAGPSSFISSFYSRFVVGKVALSRCHSETVLCDMYPPVRPSAAVHDHLRTVGSARHYAETAETRSGRGIYPLLMVMSSYGPV